MSGPQGPDPTQPWAGQQPGDPAWQQQAPEQAPSDQNAWGQAPPAYGQQYPQYQQPTAYGPTSYPQQPQYGQPPGQYGPPQPQYGQQPGQYDPQQQFSPYSSSGTDAGSKKSMAVIGGIVAALVAVLLIVVGVLGFWKPGFFMTTNLDVTAAQSGVQQILSDETNGYGAKNVEGVNCNDGANPKVEKGGTFDCEVSIDGTKRQVTVTFQDNDGTYEVGRPR